MSLAVAFSLFIPFRRIFSVAPGREGVDTELAPQVLRIACLRCDAGIGALSPRRGALVACSLCAGDLLPTAGAADCLTSDRRAPALFWGGPANGRGREDGFGHGPIVEGEQGAVMSYGGAILTPGGSYG